MGPPSRPEALAHPVNYPLSEAVASSASAEGAAQPGAVTDTLTARDYRQIVERIYARVASEIEPDMQQQLLLLRQAVEKSPDFEIAHYLLAYYSEIQLRQQRELKPGAVTSVVQQYDAVLQINPSNIGALAAQGYLWWSLNKLEKATEKFKEGLDTKAFVRQVFVGDLL